MQSIFLIFTISLIHSIQSLTCDDNCYNIELSQIRTMNNNTVHCYEYAVTLNDPTSCTITGTPRIKFAIDTDECYINADDLDSKIVSTIPDTYTLFEDPTKLIGIRLDIADMITICLKGVDPNEPTTSYTIELQDDNTQCTISDYADSPNFCGICDGAFADNACFCQSTENECFTSGRPRGDLICSWDTDNDQCIAMEAAECSTNAPIRPCICFYNEDDCDLQGAEGQTDCEWDDIYQLCNPSECIGDNLSCPCFEFEQDCESTEDLSGFDAECIWTDNDECIETTPQPTPQPTFCIGCDCFDDEVTCTGDIEGEFRCIWFDDECIEDFGSSTTEQPETTETTEMTTTTRTRTTRTPSTSTTWSKPSTSWNKPSQGWSKDNKGDKGGKSKGGKKGGKP